MKKIILIFTALALAGATTQTARADSGWCTVGKVLTGVAAGVAIGQAIAAKPVVYTAPAPVYYSTPVYAPVATYPVYSTPAPRVVYTPAPAPVVVYRAPVVYAAPVVCAPAPCVYPAVGFSVRIGGGCGGYYYHGHGHGHH
jgi:hypothetical protein